ncbi:hypothetical protein B0H16DRAFT_1895627 [Mycena metata]|uniref:Uncharacterized protein n=1 Tax=Mycena metata TaxID=1033252 RepID=A0AAD7MNH4_9AGAR|nr:hypothetical protein B0H16DRAFT_1895627 [Mycena metata]
MSELDFFGHYEFSVSRLGSIGNWGNRVLCVKLLGKKNTTKRCDSCPLGSKSISSGDFQLVPVKKARPVSSSNTTTGDKEKNTTKGSGIREQAERETMREFYAPIPSLQRVDDYPPLTRKYSIRRKAYASHYTSTWSSFKRKLATLQGRSQHHLSLGIESRNKDPQRTAQAPVRLLAELVSTRVYEMRTQLNAGNAPAAPVTDHRTPSHFLSASAARFRAPRRWCRPASSSRPPFPKTPTAVSPRLQAPQARRWDACAIFGTDTTLYSLWELTRRHHILRTKSTLAPSPILSGMEYLNRAFINAGHGQSSLHHFLLPSFHRDPR